MIKKIKNKLAFTIIMLTLTMIGGYARASELNFSVDPHLPENQINKDHTYFDLLMKPSDKQKVKINLRNDTDKEVIVEAVVSPATTNLNGVVEYGPSNNQLNETAPYNISTVVRTSEREVHIPAKGQSDLEILIDMPDKSFKGKLAGGINLFQKANEDDEQKSKEGKQGLAIENKFGYALAIILQESLEEVAPELELIKVAPGQVNARNVINATLKNTSPTYINKISVNTKINKKGEKESLYSSKKEDMQMSPSSFLVYPVPLEGKKLMGGKYELTMEVSSSKKTWSFKKEFEIASDIAKKLNEKDVTIEKSNNWLYIVIIIVIIILLMSYFYWNKQRKIAIKK